ncbi:MAG: agmatinase family protein [Phycisphaerae bacterium]|nr:agmatinase family protein [Phycisphaerae bacterium]
MPFDPDAAAQPGTGIFGLPFTREEARIVLIPVPFDATTSYGGGASGGPQAILEASAQVDLFDHQFGRVYEQGVFMEDIHEGILWLSRRARDLASPIIAAGGVRADDPENGPALAEVNRAGERVNEFVDRQVRAVLAAGKIPGLVGGDHSTPFAAIRACAENAGPDGLGVLQVDAHMDLREAFEGFTWSHASIMWNVMHHLPRVTKLVQIGIRDYGEGELNVMKESKGRVITHFDYDWFSRLARGDRLEDLCREAVAALPKHVYVSFDIDALDPSLCPHTGTPVAGGLSFNGAAMLLKVLHDSGRTIVGFDLNEVTPHPEGDDQWDANVGARVLYKLCGCAARR